MALGSMQVAQVAQLLEGVGVCWRARMGACGMHIPQEHVETDHCLKSDEQYNKSEPTASPQSEHHHMADVCVV